MAPRTPPRVPMRFRGSWRPELVRDEPRVAVAATVETPYGVMTVANAHLTFVEWWNRAAAAAPAPGPRGQPADAPHSQLDHVLLDGALPPATGSAVRLPLSDHRALVVDV